MSGDMAAINADPLGRERAGVTQSLRASIKSRIAA
jgi:hypothetical protein